MNCIACGSDDLKEEWADKDFLFWECKKCKERFNHEDVAYKEIKNNIITAERERILKAFPKEFEYRLKRACRGLFWGIRQPIP